jgi:glycosyltransferase involved in cell wall biosynthesis
MKISFIQPSRNNLKYLKWSYEAIRKNQGEHEVEICVADDDSSDGTWAWCVEMEKKDPNFKWIRNQTGKRQGHTILYDRLINEVATNDIAMIYHADMYLCPGALDVIEQEIKPGVIVSLTRIEPPLHPDGPEKILRDFGVEPEEFNEKGLLEFINSRVPNNDTTEGIFAPWAFYRKEFQEIGGHDPLYAPQSKEDSDIFNRFQLNGIKFVQTWHGCVYHMTCRGSRRNTKDKAVNIYQDSPEWVEQNKRSTRNFIRKWGHFVKHDRLMKPIIPPKYDIGFIIKNCNEDFLHALEPWADTCYVDCDYEDYITKEQVNTAYDLRDRIKPFDNEKNSEILVQIDRTTFTQQDFLIIQQLTQIIEDSGEVGEFQLGNLFINIIQMNEYQNDLIKL